MIIGLVLAAALSASDCDLDRHPCWVLSAKPEKLWRLTADCLHSNDPCSVPPLLGDTFRSRKACEAALLITKDDTATDKNLRDFRCVDAE